MTDLINLQDVERTKSVTQGDYEVALGPGILHVMIGPSTLFQASSFVPMTGLPPPSPYPAARDSLLQATPLMDNMWAVAVQKSISKQVALGWQVSDSKDIATRTRRAQGLIDHFDGNFDLGLQRHLNDFLLCDNGAWVEIARATRGGASRVEGIYHLDSLRVIRTLDPNIPAYYQNRRGEYKELRADFVQSFVDMPSPRLELIGTGMCAASRAWDTITKMAAIETYFREKATGSNQRAIYLISGVTHKQLKDGLAAGDADAVAKGFIQYKGAVLIPGFDAAVQPTMVQIDLSSIPDAFDVNQERERADAIYSHASGLWIGELRPLTGQGLGNGQQARILEEGAEGMGLAAWQKQWISFTKRVLSNTTTFAWSANDITDRIKQADLQAKQIKNVTDMKAGEFIDVRQGQQLLLDAKILPPELAPPDVTPGGVLTDDQQPGDVETRPELASQRALTVGAKAGPHTGVMLALYPDAAARRIISATPGVTEPAEDLHITLCYLGKTDETALAQNKAALIDALQRWAREQPGPLRGEVNGLGRFYTIKDGDTNPVYLAPDLPGLPQLRQSLVNQIAASGLDYNQEHGYTPHITVAYVPQDAPTPAIRVVTPLTCAAVTLAWGDEHHQFPLGVGVATKTSPTMAHDPLELTEDELAAARRLLDRVVA